jgi:hypothetical protein
MRHGMWEKVASRSHKPSMIYPFGKGGDDVMLHGTVDYELKDGKRAEGIEWAARAKFGAEDGGLKMVFYQVYLVSFFLCFSFGMVGLRGGFPMGTADGTIDMLTLGVYCRTLRLWLLRRSRVLHEKRTTACHIDSGTSTLPSRSESIQYYNVAERQRAPSPAKTQLTKVLPSSSESIWFYSATEKH